MKLKAGEMGRHVAQPSDAIRLYLFHGTDEAEARAIASRIGAALGSDVEKVAIDPGTLAADPGRVLGEAMSMSLFGDRRLITIAGVGEEGLAAFRLLLDAAQPTINPVVAFGPGLKTSGKTIKLVGAAPNAIACACYTPEGRNAVRMVIEAANDEGLRLNTQAAATLWSMCGEDRSVLAKEIEKFALFLDASPERPADVDDDAIEAVGAQREEMALFDTIALIVDGEVAQAGDVLRTLQEGPGAVPLLRQLGKRLVTLASLRAEVDAGRSIAEVVDRQRMFWKEKDATKIALRRWSGAKLTAAIGRIRQAEREQMSGASSGDIAARQLGVALANSVAKSR